MQKIMGNGPTKAKHPKLAYKNMYVHVVVKFICVILFF